MATKKDTKNSGGEGTPYSEKRKIETPTNVDSLDDLRPPKQGLSEDEAVAELDRVYDEPDTNLEGYEVADGSEAGPDSEAFEDALNRLKQSGELGDAVEALEALADLEAGSAGEGREPRGVPFDVLAEKLGISPDAVVMKAKVDGEEMEVTLEEAVAGYQRHADYTRKTEEVARTREEAESMREQYAGALEMVMTTLGNALSPEEQQAVVQQYAGIRQQLAQEVQAHRAQAIPQETAALEEALGWDDPEESQEGRRQIREYCRELGFEDDQINQVADHRVFLLAEKARRYDEIQARSEEAQKAARANRRKGRNLKPGVTGSQKLRRPEPSAARERLRRTGRVDDAAAVLDSILPPDIID